MNIFAERELAEYLRERLYSAQQEISNENASHILNINEDEYIAYLKNRYEIENLDMLFDKIYATTSERMVRAENFPRGFNVYMEKSYQKQAIEYHIPFRGSSYLLSCTPSTRIQWSMMVEIENNEIGFDIINFRNDPVEINREVDSIIKRIRTQFEYVRSEVESYNFRIESNVTLYFRTRKENLIKSNDLLFQLNVPIKNNPHVSETFSISVPKPEKRIIIEKPKVSKESYKPEPTLDDSVYQSVLKIIHDTGKQIERMPSTFLNKDEETLRDHFLMVLEPNFSGSATGETFNKKGKTDILLRYEGNNVFIAECKFWKGEKSLQKTIDQLLSYLTWRDSKAAVIIFVKNKELTSIIQKIKANISSHENFIKFVNSRDESWLNYDFHLPGDKDRLVKVAVLLFHFPEV